MSTTHVEGSTTTKCFKERLDPIGLPDYQDLPIPFGAAGYLLRYRIYQGAIYLVAIRHCKEIGYSGEKD